MFKLAIVGTIAALGLAQEHPVREELIEEIKKKASSWAPIEYKQNPLAEKSIEEIKGLLGTVIQEPSNDFPSPNAINGELPVAFDSREQWPSCIHQIRDQAHCGSCWAFAASEALSDRFCIASNGSVNVVLSPQDMVSCDKIDRGCNGGFLQMAWRYLTNTGIVADTCFPYVSGESGAVPQCATTCKDGQSFRKYRCADNSVVQAKGVDQIKAEILQHGPLETGFTVYEDFMNYQTGIYKHVSGSQLGGHAVKIIGWGDGYWVVANSWGESWGERGFFNIAFGECGIDNAAYGCTPRL